MEQNLLTTEEKKAYIERIEKKAKDDGISIKDAAGKLGLKVWSYYNYRADVRRNGLVKGAIDSLDSKTDEQEPAGPVPLTVMVSHDVMCYLNDEAAGYATEAATVGQILLHDSVRTKIKERASKETKQS